MGSFTVMHGPTHVRERLTHEGDVLRETLGRRAVGPATLVLERLGEVPMEEGERRDDVMPSQGVDEASVVIETPLVRGSATLRLDPGPGHREAVRGDAEVGHQRHVGLVPVVLIARHVARAAVPDRSGRVREHVPDRDAAPIHVDGPLHLVGRRRHPPEEVRREPRDRSAIAQPSASP